MPITAQERKTMPASKTELNKNINPFETNFPSLTREARNGVIKAVRLTTGKIWLSAEHGYLDEEGIPVDDSNVATVLTQLFTKNPDNVVSWESEHFEPGERVGVVEIVKLAKRLWKIDGNGWSYLEDGDAIDVSEGVVQQVLQSVFHE
jgi:hypothetical protein